MEIVEFIVGVLCVLAAFTVLRFMWPVLVILALICFGYSIYVRYRLNKAIRKQNETYTNMNRQFNEYQNNRREEEIEKPVSGNKIIDAEYTERDIDQ